MRVVETLKFFIAWFLSPILVVGILCFFNPEILLVVVAGSIFSTFLLATGLFLCWIAEKTRNDSSKG